MLLCLCVNVIGMWPRGIGKVAFSSMRLDSPQDLRRVERNADPSTPA